VLASIAKSGADAHDYRRSVTYAQAQERRRVLLDASTSLFGLRRNRNPFSRHDLPSISGSHAPV